jgi:hypothetical protein
MQAGLALLSVLAMWGCSSSEKVPIQFDAGSDAGSDGGGNAAFTFSVLDPDAPGTTSMAIASSGSKIGVAYFVELANGSADAGYYELRYVEPGQQPQKVRTANAAYPYSVHNDYGVSLAFTSAGNPVIAYLGGNSNGGTYWLESDLAIATRSGSTWTSAVAAADSIGGGEVVGLYPALGIGPNDQLFAAYRDVHYGQFPVQDWQHSNLEIATGQLGGLTASLAVNGANGGGINPGDPPAGNGGVNSLVVAGGEPAIAYSLMSGGARDTPVGVWFTRRKAGAFATIQPKRVTKDIANAVAGPSLAWDATSGYGIACEDRTKQTLYYFHSADGDDWTAAPMNVWGLGTGGWWPSLAFDPSGTPTIAFYFCSDRSGVQQCPEAEDELKVARLLPSDQWALQTVDTDGAYLPRLTFAGGKAAVAYKSTDTKHQTLKLAVER